MKAVNVNDVLKIIHKYGSFIFITDCDKYSEMEYEIANLPAISDLVLEDIKAEIQALRNCSCNCSDGIIDDVEDIIDKHISGKE